MKIQQKLYTYISDRNISLKELSGRTGISEKRLMNIFVKEECELAVDEYVAVCGALELPVDYFSTYA